VRRLTGGYILSPAPRLMSSLVSLPPVRRLTGGYILSPAPRAPVFVGHPTPGSPTHRGLHSVARCAGSGLCWSSYPRFVDSPGDSVLSPAARAHVLSGLHSVAAARARVRPVISPAGSRLPVLCLLRVKPMHRWVTSNGDNAHSLEATLATPQFSRPNVLVGSLSCANPLQSKSIIAS